MQVELMLVELEVQPSLEEQLSSIIDVLQNFDVSEALYVLIRHYYMLLIPSQLIN